MKGKKYDVDKKGPSRTPGESMDIDKRNKRFKTPPCAIDNKEIEMPISKSLKQIIGEAKEIQEAIRLLEKKSPAKKTVCGKCVGKKPIKENEMPYDNLGQEVDSSPEDTDNMNYSLKNPEKLEDDLPVEKLLKSGRFNKTKLRLEYFKNLLNNAKELNEKI